MLERWKKSFLKTRMDIELSRKEKRWEFDINLIFADTDHINNICKDMILICKILMEIKNCFGEEMKKITMKPKFLDSAIKKIEGTTQGMEFVKWYMFYSKYLHMSTYDTVSDHLESLSTSVPEILTACRLNGQCSGLYG